MKNDPKPPGSEKVMGHSGIFRVKCQDIRVIYGISESIRHVFIIDVRKRNEATYKNIPTQALNRAVTEAITILKNQQSDS